MFKDGIFVRKGRCNYIVHRFNDNGKDFFVVKYWDTKRRYWHYCIMTRESIEDIINGNKS